MTHWFMFSSGVQALKGYSQQIGTISDNIANSTTVGYKTVETRFSELLSATKTQNPAGNATFSGMRAQTFQFLDRDGVISNSTNQLHAALLGRGFFVTQNSDGGYELTDAGNFEKKFVTVGGEEQTFLADLKGNYVLGWPADATGVVTPGTDLSSLQRIRIDPGSIQNAARPTTTMQVIANLNNQTATGDTYTISTQVYDGTGTADGVLDQRDISYVFTKGDNPNEWTLDVQAEAGGTVTAPTTPLTVTFDADGNLLTPTNLTVGVTWTSPAATSSIATNFLGLNQYDSPSVVQTLDYDGNSQGEFVDVTYSENGDVIARFNNETQKVIARIAAANVPSAFNLQAVGDTHWKATGASGDIQLFDIATTDQFRLIPNALEQSGTDIADEFGKLIMAQSAYNSAATAVRTVDEMTQTVVRLRS